MKQHHVLFLMSSFNIGGAEIDVLNLSSALLKRGYKITVASNGGDLEKQLPEQVRILRMNVSSSSRWMIIFNMLRVFFYTMFHQVTVLNPQSLKGIVLGLLAGKILRIPMIATIHNLHDPEQKADAVKLLNKIPDIVLFVSEYERQKFVEAGLCEDCTRVMYSGIDLDKYTKDTNSGQTHNRIGIIGRLSPEKGVEHGIKAFAKASSNYRNTQLVIVGDGPERGRLEQLVCQLNIASKVRFEGARNDVPQILNNIDFLLLPSLSESLSVVAREAMATGKPVVGTRVGGMHELIEHQHNGLLVESGDVNAMAHAISDCVASHEKRESMGTNARNVIENKFSLQRWVANMDDLYRQASGERGNRGISRARKNVLYVTTRFPFPKIKGDKLRAYHQIVELSKSNNVILMTLLEDKNDTQYFDELKPFCKKIIPVSLPPKTSVRNRRLSHLSWTPSQVAYFYNREFKNMLPKVVLAHDIDTVYCQLIRAGQYAAKLKNVWKVIDFVDAFSLNLKRNIQVEPWYRKPAMFLRTVKVWAFEQKMIRSFDKAIIISKNDQKALGHDEIFISPNGVAQPEEQKFSHETREKALIFSGNMDYWPNEDAARYLVEEIMPHLDNDIKVYLVGINNNPQVKKYQSDRVIVTGKVPSMKEYFDKASIAVCPMRLGAGQQNKVLEAMAAGVPVVASDVANSGIGATDSLILANSAIEFADQINVLMKHPLKQAQLVQKAYRFIRDKFNWSQIMNQLEGEIWKTSTQPQTAISSNVPLRSYPMANARTQ
ncbi:MAG: glycosyltransferase [SAR324 cluster bacterium]|nr:glycosyltransferase [SAR324 cluster bacterium]